MNKLRISKNETQVLNKKDTFIRTVITSLKHKINDPLGKRKVNDQPAITASNNNATIFVILIIGLTAGPAVSL